MKALKVIGLLGLVVYFNNASWLRDSPQEELTLLAHRGAHQTYSKEGLLNDSCTATRIDPPQHKFLENTVESIEQAFAYGAKIVEIDIHPTTDGRFAVIHDWAVDCRTEGKGVTRQLSLAYLQSLDIGFGYTHDGGKTFPFRGEGVGKMPSLSEVLDTFPVQKFLINIKSNDLKEADLLNSLLQNRPNENVSRLWVYGGAAPTARLLGMNSELRGFSANSIKQCVVHYELLAWTGYVPESCRNTIVGIPIDYAPYLWGWPRAFMSRMKQVNTQVILTGWSNGHSDGIDDPERIKALSQDFRGIIWTDKIESVGHLGNPY